MKTQRPKNNGISLLPPEMSDENVPQVGRQKKRAMLLSIPNRNQNT